MMRKSVLRLSVALLLLSAVALACNVSPEEEPAPSVVPAEEAGPGQAPPLSPDKWSLWTDGTRLRGANIWQRVVVPELDGPDFLGSGHVGPPYTQADFDWLAALGANYVNISHPGLFTERPPYVLDEEVQANLDRLLEMAAQADLFAVITFRTGPGRSDFTFYRDGAGEWFDPELLVEWVWTDQEAQDGWVEMWRYAAQRYRDNPVVAGYDLMCEPNSDDVALGIWEPDEFYPQYAGTLYDWNQFYPRIVAAIRQVDPETPILVSAAGWGAVRWLPYLAPTDDPHTVYTVHPYAPHEYTHQEPPAAVTYPGELDLDWDGEPDPFDRAWLEEHLGVIADFQQEHDVPVAANEFGVMRWVPGAADFMADEMDLFETLGVNYALWVWDPAWEPWASQVDDFNFRHGPDPDRHVDVASGALQETIIEHWSRNTLRPSHLTPRTALPPLAEVRHWLYLIDSDLDAETVAQIAASDYDLVVLDFIPSQQGNRDFPMADVVARLHAGPHPRWVVAYADIGQAEAYRTYWQEGWGVGEPDWIAGEDPDGWADDYPVAFWREEWRDIWLGEDGLLAQMVAAGFDGVYLDWVEAYSDENVLALAERDGVDARQEMVDWVRDIAHAVRERCAHCIVIAQNGAELAARDDYRIAINGLAQEHVWFDGGPDNEPPGDCPLPRREADVDADAYRESLPRACRRLLADPDSTLHTSSEEVLRALTAAQERGLTIFTVDYALEPENVLWVVETSRGLGFIPFAGSRALDRYVTPVP